MSTPLFVDPEISTQADGAQSSRVRVPLLKDPYEAFRQAYLVRTDTESEPFKDPVKTETPESPHIVAPPTCHVEESEGSGTSGARSRSSNSTAPLLPYHPLTHTTPVLVPSLGRTVRMAVRVSPVMSLTFSVSIAEEAAMPDLAFYKRFGSFYDSSPSPTFLVWKRYRGTSELILDTNSEGDELRDKDDDEEEDEEVEESLDSDSKSENAEEEGPTIEDEDPTTGDEGLAVGDESPGSERPERVSALRQPTLTTWIDPKDGIAYIDVLSYPPLAPLVQTPPSPEWSCGSVLVCPTHSIVPSPISSPMISLSVPSPVPSPATVEAEGFLTQLGAQVEMQEGLIRDHTV
uniref:Uncharacterized protein n=1 Tax=Tanacetum cinerariifolium TaxID=118510 RepID=A0A699HSN0_TANCI|nr:hypothetical protein [Tanacetum cinerariifolium]